jgi:dTMP kinase
LESEIKNKPGLFITFEGIEGSGKTTLMELVANALRQRGLDPLLTREPGGTELGLALRRVLLDPQGTGMEAATELLLFGADRAQHVAEVIRPALVTGRVVLCDRFSDATGAYQGHGRGISLQAVKTVDRVARGETRPDLTVLLDLPEELGLARAKARNTQVSDPSESRIDEEELAFHRKVREGYLHLAGQDPERFMVLDARKDVTELGELILEELTKRFPNAL